MSEFLKLEQVIKVVKVDSLKINEHYYLFVTLALPGFTTRLIYCTGGILFDESWSLDKVGMRCRVPVCIGKGKTDEELLNNPILDYSFQAEKKGIHSKMCGKEALLQMVNEN